MKSSCMALLALFAVSGLEAHAQTPAPTAFEGKATALAGTCLAAKPTPEGASAAVLVCEKLIVDLAALKAATPSLAGHDLNVYHIVTSMAESRVAASFGRIDGVRSARVCQRTEQAWSHTAQVVVADSPSYASVIENLKSSTRATIGTCRSEFGTPPGAWPI